jgi:hypothetical protein
MACACVLVVQVDHVHSAALSPDGSLLATADEYGKVNIFRWVELMLVTDDS